MTLKNKKLKEFKCLKKIEAFGNKIISRCEKIGKLKYMCSNTEKEIIEYCFYVKHNVNYKSYLVKLLKNEWIVLCKDTKKYLTCV